MAKPKEKLKAMRLRQNGHSINAIATQLNVSKSTVSHWCKNISLTEKQIDRIATQSKHHATTALLRSAEKQRAERLKRVEEERLRGQNRVGTLSDRDVFMVGLGLYWGEGYKKGSQELGFTNSDLRMIKFYIRWLALIYDIAISQLIFRVSINQLHKHRETEVLKFWITSLGAQKDQFTKTSFIKTTSKKNSYTTEHYGTLRVKVRKGTLLRQQILGSIASLN